MAASRKKWFAPALALALAATAAPATRAGNDSGSSTGDVDDGVELDDNFVPSGGLEIEAEEPIPYEAGKRLDVMYPALGGWTHPVADSSEVVPLRPQRKFGAERDGRRGRCGFGHCGVDLDGPRGRTIVAVQTGRVANVEHRRRGKDGKSGRYVRIEHDGGVFTAYMHLDSIAPGLSVGDAVEPGQFIGRLGKTGIRHGEPHLHFNLELPADNPTKKVRTKLINPTPYLQRAKVISDPVRRDLEERRKAKS